MPGISPGTQISTNWALADHCDFPDYHPRTRSHTTLIERRGGDKLQCPFMNEFPLANITTVACPATSKQQMLQGFMFLGHIRGLTTSNVARLNKLDLPAAFRDQRSSLTSQAVSGVALLMPYGRYYYLKDLRHPTYSFPGYA